VFLEDKVYSADWRSAPIVGGRSGGVVVARPLGMAASAQRSLLQVFFTSVPPVNIILDAPRNITYCSNLRLDTSLSTGDAGAYQTHANTHIPAHAYSHTHEENMHTYKHTNTHTHTHIHTHTHTHS
jgi:hypothetical protein